MKKYILVLAFLGNAWVSTAQMKDKFWVLL